MIKPILAQTDKCEWPNCIWLGRISNQLRLDKSYKDKIADPIDDSMLPQHISLIDTKAEIVEGDMYIDDSNQIRISTTSDKDYWSVRKDYNKIIASNDKSHKTTNMDNPSNRGGFHYKYLPQLSEQAIKALIDYYNKHQEMPESVEVEMNEIDSEEYHAEIDYYGKTYLKLEHEIKLNQQGEVDITIPEVEEKLYTKEDLEEAWNDGSQLRDLGHLTFKEWFNSKKK